jgi:SPP1 family predicted phage head-tail adaptor
MTLYRINAGKYRHIVYFQRLKDAQNSYGETVKSDEDNWENAFKTRVGIFPISGKEVLTDEVIKGEVSHRIHMRYISGVDSSMRIKFGNRIFDIVSPPINFQEKNLEIQLMCKEREIPLVGVNHLG